MTSTLEQALQGIGKDYRKRLVSAYVALKRDLIEARPDSAGLNAGKLCEAVIRHLQHRVTGASTPFGTKINNFADECRKIITAKAPNGMTDSEKVIIPRALVFLYTMRNKRGIGHVGGDVDANSIDAVLMGRVADWIVCELIRIHHGLSLEEAQDIVDAASVRQIADIWEVGGKRRVLREGLKAREEVLLLLYSAKEQAVLTEDLVSWIEYSNPRVFKSNVLHPLHKSRLVEWDRDSDTVTLSPKGAKHIEDHLLKSSG